MWEKIRVREDGGGILSGELKPDEQERLDAIVHELETGQVPLERAMSLFEEGLRLGAACRTLLDGAQVDLRLPGSRDAV